MRIPIRKPGKYTHLKNDPCLTIAKINEFKAEFEKLKKNVQPKLADEVRRLAQLGDLSENAAYQIAKGKLRGINQRIINLENIIKKAIVIKTPKDNKIVQLGSLVALEISGVKNIYQILGSSEADPLKGIISHNSPIGAAIIGKNVGADIIIRLKNKNLKCKIIKIE